ncbi:MAG: halocyanin domain-containing protein [Haloferacaceae archaeon]
MNRGDTTRPRPRRRQVLRAGATAAAATLGIGAGGTATAQSTFGGWLDGVGNYDGVVDRTGRSEVTVTVGAQGNGGSFAFGPPAVRVDPGTTVVWKWNGKGGQHNVVAESGAGFESELTGEAGHTFSRTFDAEGVVKYYCAPHRSLGMKGVVVVGGTGGGASGSSGGGSGANGEPDYGGWLDDVGNYDGRTVDKRGQSEVRITVGAEGNGGAFAFDPPAVRVDSGTRIVWKWTGKGGQHNVVAESGGDFRSDLVQEGGHTFSTTLESSGIVTYYCSPHRSLGMKGAIAVGDDVPTASAGGGRDGAAGTGGQGGGRTGGGTGFPVSPAGIVGYVLAFGLPGLLAVSILVAEFWPSRADAGTAVAEDGIARETTSDPPTRELGHEEYDPIGTGSLLIAYFVLLVLLWMFMYFVEFLGRGPTIIG